MADVMLTKGLSGLVPSGEDAQEWFAKLKAGATVRADIRVMRNAAFHRKFFAMLRVAYENHDWPEIDTQWGPAKCTYDQFRKYITVKSGHFDMVVTPRGDVRAEARSIAFSKMDEAEFDRLYSDALDFILQEYLAPKGWTREQMDEAVNKMLSFC
jgi:hypothetical protein